MKSVYQKILIILISILLIGCGNKNEEVKPFTTEEMAKVEQIVEKHYELIGTGHWSYVSSITHRTDESNNVYLDFDYHSSFHDLPLSERYDIGLKYEAMTKAFANQVGLKRELKVQ